MAKKPQKEVRKKKGDMSTGSTNKVNDVDAAQEKKADKYGEPYNYDPTFNGPIKKRGCTDIICLLIFPVFFLGMFVVGYFAFLNGDPTTLIYPTDSQGKLCGYGEHYQRPFLVYFDLLDCAKLGPAVLATGCPTPQVCVEKCPTTYWTWIAQEAYERTPANAITGDPKAQRSKMICKYDVDAVTSTKSVASLVLDDDCAGYYTESADLLGRCIPSFLKNIVDSSAALVADINSENSTIVDRFNNTVTGGGLTDATYWLQKVLEFQQYGVQIFSDLESAKYYVIGGLFISLLVALFWIVLMRWVAGIIMWCMMFLFVGLFAGCAGYSYWRYYTTAATVADSTGFVFTTDFAYYTNLRKTWLAFGCTSATCLTILLLILIFLRNRIRIAIALIKEGSRAIGNMMFTLLWPLIPFVLQVLLIAYCGTVAVFLYSWQDKSFQRSLNSTLLNTTTGANSSAIKTYSSDITSYQQQAAGLLDTCDSTNITTLGNACNFARYELSQYSVYLTIYNLFMFFWCMNFIIGFGQMVLAGSFASYYWAYTKPNDIPTFPILASVWRALFFHMGSIAFGALIIAIIQMIRVALEFLDNRVKGSENPVAKFVIKCLKCCFWCLEKFMKMINKNAYILIAVYGKNFCTSAKNAFFLIMRNILRVAVVDRVSAFLLFISKLVVVALVGLLAFFFFSGQLSTHITFLAKYQVSLNFYLAPVIVICIGAFIIATVCFSVYSMAVDALFLCFLEDLEKHDGSMEKPYYMNQELKDILGKKNDADKKKKPEKVDDVKEDSV